MSVITESELQQRLQYMHEDGVSEFLCAGVGLMFSAGLRVSDLLSIDYRNVSINLIIEVPQSKGSNTLTVQPIYYRDVWRLIYDNKLAPFSLYDRFFMYRLFKKYSLQINNGSGRNASVTHAGRKYLANAMYSDKENIESAKKALGHKSANSTRYYIDEDYRRGVLARGLGGAYSGEVSNIVVQKNNVIRIARIPQRSRKVKYK